MNRLSALHGHLRPSSGGASHAKDNDNAVSKPALLVVDGRTGSEHAIPIRHGSVKAKDFAQIRAPREGGLVVYDPGQVYTAVCSSRITYIDGEKGILRYRGYPIEALAEKVTFEECAFLLMYGELPTSDQLSAYGASLKTLSVIPTSLRKLIKTFKPDAHPMGMLVACLAAAGTLYPEANPCVGGQAVLKNPLILNKHLLHVLAMTPTLAANIQRFREGLPLANGDQDLGFTAGFLALLDKKEGRRCLPHPVLVKALDILFVLHADHELNCSTAAVRHVASSNADIYTAMAAATGALYGPRHGGANEAVVRMLERIGSASGVPAFIQRVKDRKERLMGFGHRVYKSYDPRAHIIRKVADLVFEVVGASPLIYVAKELEQTALQVNNRMDSLVNGSFPRVQKHKERDLIATQRQIYLPDAERFMKPSKQPHPSDNVEWRDLDGLMRPRGYCHFSKEYPNHGRTRVIHIDCSTDPYFTSRKLYPNVDFYSGVVYKAMGFPVEFFPLLFAIPRMAGWTAHFREFTEDAENRIARPLQIYLGHGLRPDLPPLAQRQRVNCTPHAV